MAEMLVRVVDSRNLSDPEKDRRLLKRGDVVTIQPDGWPWSQRERTNPEWRIVKVPGAKPSDLSAFEASDPDPRLARLPTEPQHLPRRRQFRLDLAVVDSDKRDTWTLAELLAAQKPVAKVRNPRAPLSDPMNL